MGTRWTYFRDGLKIDPNEIIGNFRRLRLGSVMPRDDTTTAAITNGALDLGSDSVRWRDMHTLYLDVGSTTNVKAIEANVSSIHGSGTVYVTNQFKHPSAITSTAGAVFGTAGPLLTGTSTYIEAFRLQLPANTLASGWTATGITTTNTRILETWVLRDSGLTTGALSMYDDWPIELTSNAIRIGMIRLSGGTGTAATSAATTIFAFVRYMR